MTLYGFQETGADFLAARNFALLADEMGLGKTVQAITAANRRGFKRALVIAPHIGLVNWQREIDEWADFPFSRIITNQNPFGIAPWELVNYDLFSIPAAAAKTLREQRYDLIILDECQALKEYTARRTKEIYGKGGIASRAGAVWLLSGTPAPNHVGELYAHLKACFPAALRTPKGHMPYDDFLHRYCKVKIGQHGLKVVGLKNMGELRRVLAPFALRRIMTEVLPDMPRLRFSRLTLDPKAAKLALDRDPALASVEDEVYIALNAAIAKVEAERPGTTPDDRLIAAMEMIDGQPIALLRRLFGEALAPLVAETVDQELHAGLDKIIVFYHHKNVGAALESRLAEHDPLRMDGSTPRQRRHEIIDRFQSDPTAKVILAQLDVAHRVITLTAAAHVLFCEASWTPSVNFQAARRALRIGQKRPVLARFAVLAGSLHEYLMRTVVRKTALLAELWDEEPEDLSNLVREGYATNAN